MGRQGRVFEIIKEMPPLDHFTHEFFESDKPESLLAAKADVILADLHGMDAEKSLESLLSGKGKETELILLADREQILILADRLPEVKDVWTMPMSDEEIRFRFLRWQQTCKLDRDFRQTTHYLEAAINNVPDPIWYRDRNGIYKKVNDSFCKMVGRTKDQVEGSSHACIGDAGHDCSVCMESELEAMNKKAACMSEKTIETADGVRRLVIRQSPLYDLDGSVMGTVGVAADVTQERACEEEIKKKDRVLEMIFTTIDCGILCHTTDGSRILSINKAALKILGYESQEEMMAGGFDMIAASVVDEDKPRLRACIRRLKHEGDSINLEYRVQHRDGEVLHVMGNIKLIRENGKLLYQRFLLDCTARKLEEKKNERHQMELVQALAIDYNLVCHIDLDTGRGVLLRADEEMEGVFDSDSFGKISLKKSRERYIQRFVHKDDREMFRQAFSRENLKRELEEEKQYYVNYRTFRNGVTRYYVMKAVRAGIWDGSHGAVLGFRCVDEETRKEMESKSLLEDALLQANNASKAKSVFLSNMSHDIRTPMNAIVGFTNLAITQIDQKEIVEEYLKKIMVSGNHLLGLINDILDMSRIESGKMRLEEAPCSLPDVLHELYNIVQNDVYAKKLELCMDAVDVYDEEVCCDRLRLNQVLLNLLGNSVKYTEEGGTVSLRVTETAGESPDCANYEFCIKDTGIGMSEEFISHIFEPFEREKSTTISRIQGTGLGMAITKKIVDMMHGDIEVKSEQGAGTEVSISFTFRLSGREKEPQVIPEFKNCRALIVDDDRNTCGSVSYMLQQIGMRTEWTLSGEEAVLRARQAAVHGDGYSVYMIDWRLPDMDGAEVIRRIRQETGGDTSVFVMTAYDWPDIRDKAREAGAAAFCSKPLFLSELRSCFYSIVNEDEEDRESSREEPERIQTGRILVAEDTEVNQEVITAILDHEGYSVEIAENGQEAVDMLKKSEPGYYQLVLMDVQMPVMNGYEAAMAIRRLENEKLSSIPILAMTANAFEEDKQEALKCGMNGHIAKPIDVKRLLETLNKILR